MYERKCQKMLKHFKVTKKANKQNPFLCRMMFWKKKLKFWKQVPIAPLLNVPKENYEIIINDGFQFLKNNLSSYVFSFLFSATNVEQRQMGKVNTW